MRVITTFSSIQQFVFDDVIVDCENFRIVKAGEVRSLTPRAFDVLVFLIENQGRVVEKGELFENVWKEKFVSDNALTRSIKEIRHAIGDNAESPLYIETVPRRGYRFIATVSTSENADTHWASHSALGGQDVSVSLNQPATRFSKFWSALLLAGVLLSGLTAYLVISKPWKKSTAPLPKPSVARNTQITTWTGLDLFPTISPDGNMVAYSSDHSGKFEIYVRALSPGAKENQLTSDGLQNLEPSWSPDGKWIAYYSQVRGGISIIPAGGGVARQLIDFGSRPSWSRDGSKIAFQSDGLSDISTTSAAAPTSTIWIISASGGDPYQITHPSNPVGGHGSPTWSPDSQRIAFVANSIQSSTIWTITPKGDDLKRVTPERCEYFDPIYSPDGRSLFMVSGGVWRVLLSANGEPESEPEQLANPTLAQIRHLSFSANGKRLVSSLIRQRGNLWSVPLQKETAERSGVPKSLVEDTTIRKTIPLFSTDGSKLAYNVFTAGASGSVWIVDVNGKERTQISTDPAAIVGWMPDGRQLLNVTFLESGRYLTTTVVDSGLRKTISSLTRQIPFCRLSPDGKTIAFNAYTGSSVNIWLYSIDNGEAKQITFDNELFGFPAWSPDGKWIAGELKRNDDTYIAVVPVEGGTPVALNSDRGQSWTGSWSPDGDKIVFAGSRNGIWNIYWISRSTKEQKQLTNYTKPNSFVRYPTWSPRGDQIVFEYSELTGNIWLAELK